MHRLWRLMLSACIFRLRFPERHTVWERRWSPRCNIRSSTCLRWAADARRRSRWAPAQAPVCCRVVYVASYCACRLALALAVLLLTPIDQTQYRPPEQVAAADSLVPCCRSATGSMVTPSCRPVDNFRFRLVGFITLVLDLGDVIMTWCRSYG